jgi:Sulfotransferase domain
MLKKIVSRVMNSDGSVSVDDPKVVKSFTDNPDFPYLVSFSRTGSHWLRMIMELYFEKPSLVRAFYFKDATDFTCYHRHDIELELRRQNVIYLYRNPVETVYSQLGYYKENLDDPERRHHWTDLYARHLAKWLVHDDFTTRKTVITYEGMKSNMHGEIEKLCRHFGQEYDPVKLDSVLAKVSKDELKKKTKHDQQVVNLSDSYRNEREVFRNNYGKLIIDELYSIEPALEKFFYRAKP